VTELQQVAELVRSESGIALKPNQRRALAAAIRRAVPGENAAGFLRLAADPAQRRKLVRRLLDEVTIQETSFLRDRAQLEEIDWNALREQAEGPIRIWVAACATGEEAYTMALLACEAFSTTRPPVEILGTDISGTALEQAAEGLYRRRAVVDVEPTLLERYFTRAGRGFQVTESLKRPVRFLRHNLVRDPVPPLGEERFDLILCRNVLIYFDSPAVEHVLAALEAALRPRGTLVLGAADVLHDTNKRLADETPPPAPKVQAPRRQPDATLAEALHAADRGRRAEALEMTAAVLKEDPLNAEAHFVRGMVELSAGAATAAVESLRRVLSVDPRFAVAAFVLGRAYEELGDPREARRAYERALEALDPEDHRYEQLLEQIDLGDIATACRERIGRLR
jgi:chemotaxis methyl-accepting protein methylase